MGFEGRVAVVTGAASGIGYGIAGRAASAGMKVVVADIEEGALQAAVRSLADKGADVTGMVVDVSDKESVDAFAAKVSADIGQPWLVVNNAGVGSGGPFLQTSHEQWRFVLGVNLWGVVNGCQAFLPGLVERDDGYLVNTASMAGLLTVGGSSNYIASKHAVVGLTETIYRELAQMGSAVGVSCLCPGGVVTNIFASERNWPASLGQAPAIRATSYPDFPERKDPSEVGDLVFDAIGERRFWVLTHPWQYEDAIRARAEHEATGANPDASDVDPILAAARSRAH